MRRWLFPALLGLVMAGVAYQVTLLATPFALMRAAAAKAGAKLPVNSFGFGPMTTADNQTIVRPSPDLSYSICVFDASNGPVLIGAEPIPGHYWSVSIFDARTDVVAVRSDRDTGGKPARLAIVRKGQTAPAGYEPVKVGYARGVVLLRILLSDKTEYPAIDALRRKSYCRIG
ncbi:MAG: DUF1254 domain-containing protein [Sphingomonas sp.]